MLLQVKHRDQLCNRLFALLPAMAYAVHNKVKLYVFFEEKQYLDYFPDVHKNHWVKFLLGKDDRNSKKKIRAKLERALLRMADKSQNAVNGDLREKMRLGGLHFIDGWEHRSDLSFIEEERETLLDLFKPRQDIMNHVDECFGDYDGVTVGVHVRRGDYKKHRGGIWYFDDGTYLDIIQDIKNQLMQKGVGNVRFLICSNEPFALRNEVAEMFQIAPLFPTDCMSDLYGLSKCDYIIGPPSTFSQWASFTGNKPLNVIFKKGDEVRLEAFSPIVRLDRFANNTGYYDKMN
jgi:hypothetical protein